MGRKRGDFEAVRPLLDLGSEEVASWSEEEARARAAEEGFDLEANANAFRTAIENKGRSEGSARLKNARAALDARQQSQGYGPTRKLTGEELRKRRDEILASEDVPKDSRLMLAFREGREIDEEDLRSLIEDYEELLQGRKDGEDSA